jgi:N-acetylglutamate synthase-like GNAT family acetyltransferase
MNAAIEIVSVDAANVDEHGFFCYKSKPKTPGYANKLAWLRQRFQEGMQLKIVYEAERSVGFIEYIPGEYAWRAVYAPEYMVIHCLWVVGKAKGKGYGARLLELCLEDARQQGKRGVVMISSRGNWLAHEKIFLQHGFTAVDTAPPSFQLLVANFVGGSLPAFPTDWEARQAAYGQGATIVYADQCPYMPDAMAGAVAAFEQRGVPTRTVKLEDAEAVQQRSPSPYGVFSIVYNGRLFCYHYLGAKELRALDTLLQQTQHTQ